MLIHSPCFSSPLTSGKYELILDFELVVKVNIVHVPHHTQLSTNTCRESSNHR